MEAQPRTQDQGTISLDPRYTDDSFTRVPNWVIERLGTLSRDARYTFIVLLKYARQDGHCWPGMDRLTVDLGASRQSVHHWIKELETVGLVEVVRRGMGRSNDYKFHWPDWLDADVNPALHGKTDVNQALRQPKTDVNQALHSDVKPGLHYLDTSTKTHGTPRTPVDISINVDTSAPTEDRRNKQPARARKGSSYSVSELDPLDEWVQKAIGAIQTKREEDTISARTRALWADAVERTLGNLSQGERDAYIFYLLSDGYIPSRSSPQAVADAIKADYRTWERTGRPRTKEEGFKRPPKVPAHVQWERDRAHKPKKDTPERTARIFADLRKYKGEEFAQRWLAEQNQDETGT